MASVRLNFVPPAQPNIVKLYVYESTTKEGSYNEIDTTMSVGSYPDYISEYTTQLATGLTNWFRIEWENAAGARSGMSAPVQGGTSTLVGQIIDLVMLRDPNLDENVIKQEVEAAIESFFQVEDPYSLPENYGTYTQRLGLTYLAQARASLASVIISSQTGSSYTAGLVSQKADSGTTTVTKNYLDDLLKQANVLLGTSYTVIMLIEDIQPLGIGETSAIEWDESRGLMTEYR